MSVSTAVRDSAAGYRDPTVYPTNLCEEWKSSAFQLPLISDPSSTIPLQCELYPLPLEGSELH